MSNIKRVKPALIAALIPIVVLGVAAQPAMGQVPVPPPIKTYEEIPAGSATL